MKKDRFPWLVFVASVLLPTDALAFMNAPTLGATFPAIVVLLIPFVAAESCIFSKCWKVSLRRAAVFSLVTCLITMIAMFIVGRLHYAIIMHLYGYYNILPDGISSLAFIKPSGTDVFYSLTLGSAVLVQREGYFICNVIVIAVFLVPTLMASSVACLPRLRKAILGVAVIDSARVACRVKSVEYGVLVAGSLLFAWYYLNR